MNTRSELRIDLERLQKICEMPRLFLADYFIELRNQVDKEIVSKQVQSQHEAIEFLKQTWTELIEKIETFERKCYSNQKVKDKTLETLLDRLSLIEMLLNDESVHDWSEFQVAIQTEDNLLKHLFKNKTIRLLNLKSYQSVSEKIV